MSYLGHYSAPADPVIIPHSADPSSPPSIEESQLGSSTFPSSSGIPRLPQVKLRIKLGRETPQSAPQIMESSVAYQYGNNEDDSGEDGSFRFSGVNANAVRSSINNETNGSEAAADNESNADDTTTTEQTTPKKGTRERKRTSDSGSKKSGKKGSGKRGRKPKVAEKPEEEYGEEEEGDEEEDDVYEVERILAHDWAENGVLRYKVKWVGFAPEFDTFEPESMLESAKERIAEYKKSLPVETRAELEAGNKEQKKKAGRGRPSNATKSGKRPRADSPDVHSDESDADAKESDDDDYKVEKKSGPSTSSATRSSRGRPVKSKGELKLFASPKSTGPPRKKPFLENRQGWLESGSDSDSDNDSKKAKKSKEVRESPAPKTGGGGRKKRGASDEASMTNGRHSSRGVVASSAAVIEGLYRHDNGEMDVVIGEGRAQRVVPLREAFDIVGFGLVQFLADRFQFQA